jgi:hypothetical protein
MLMSETARRKLQAQYGAEIKTLDYMGRVFGAFHARRNPWGRGFVVYGRGFGANTYSATLVTVCARPAAPRRAAKAWRGFATKREAQSLADSMNQASAPSPAC